MNTEVLDLMERIESTPEFTKEWYELVIEAINHPYVGAYYSAELAIKAIRHLLQAAHPTE